MEKQFLDKLLLKEGKINKNDLDLALAEQGKNEGKLEHILVKKGYVKEKEIASDAHITSRTVKSHMQNIFQKLNVKTRTEAMSLAFNSNLI